MALFDELLPASFRGASFLIDSSTTTGGRKNITHEYPNSDRRNVEDLGLLNKTFEIVGTISEPNYTAKKNVLLRALERPDVGLLIHPLFGVRRVVPKPYTLEEQMTGLGEATFRMTFEVAQDPIQPSLITGSLSDVFSAVNQAIQLIKTGVIQALSITSSDNFLDALSKTDGFFTTIDILSSGAITDPAALDTFGITIQNAKTDAPTLISNPASLADVMVLAFTDLDDAISQPSDSAALFENLYTFGDTDETNNFNTFKSIEQKTNRDILNGAIQALALLMSYRNVPQINFLTVDEINEQQEKLDTQFDKIISNPVINDSDKSQIVSARVKTRRFFENAKLQAFKVINFDTEETTISEIVYRLYGDLSLYQNIIDLNGFFDVKNISGTIKILSN